MTKQTVSVYFNICLHPVVPGAPMCNSRFMSPTLTSVGVGWQSPDMGNGIITAFYVEILTYRSEQVLQSSSLSDLTYLTLNLEGLTLGMF